MVSVNTFFIILAISSIVVAFIIIYLARKAFSSKLNLFKGFAVIVILFCVAGYFTHTNVYIFGQTVNKSEYTHQIIFYPTDIQLPNGKTVNISPRFGLNKSWVINLSKTPLYFEKIRYGSANERMIRQKLPSYQATKVDYVIDYILVDPPAYIRVKGDGTTRGWIHY